MITIELHGMELTLEERKCAVCENTFKVLAKSSQKYHSRFCMDRAEGVSRTRTGHEAIRSAFLPWQEVTDIYG